MELDPFRYMIRDKPDYLSVSIYFRSISYEPRFFLMSYGYPMAQKLTEFKIGLVALAR